jgi:hypothetical protein
VWRRWRRSRAGRSAPPGSSRAAGPPRCRDRSRTSRSARGGWATATSASASGGAVSRDRRGGVRLNDTAQPARRPARARTRLLRRRLAPAADTARRPAAPPRSALEQPDEDLRSAIGASLVDADRLEATIEELLTLARERDGRVEPLDLVACSPSCRRSGPAVWPCRAATSTRDRPGASTGRALRPPRSARCSLCSSTTPRRTVAERWQSPIREAADAVAIDVSDEGPGWRCRSRPVHPTATTANTHGIGLALARRLAEAEHGRLRLTRSSPPVFTLCCHLPASGRRPAETPATTASVLRASGASSSRYP